MYVYSINVERGNNTIINKISNYKLIITKLVKKTGLHDNTIIFM